MSESDGEGYEHQTRALPGFESVSEHDGEDGESREQRNHGVDAGDNEGQSRLTAKKGRFDYTFTTENRLQPDRAIEIQLVDGPFKKLHGQWRFEPADGGCLVTLELEFVFPGRIVGAALTVAFTPIANSFVEAFRKRAYAVYGE